MEMQHPPPHTASGTTTPTQQFSQPPSLSQQQQQKEHHQYTSYPQQPPLYRPSTPNDRPRSVSIQSLISSPVEHRNIISPASTPGTTPAPEYHAHGVKRKGLESEDDEDDNGRVVIDDPDVRIAAEALGDLRADFANSTTRSPLSTYPHSTTSTTLTSPGSSTPTSYDYKSPPPTFSSPEQPQEQRPGLLNRLSSRYPITNVLTTAYTTSKSYSPRFRYGAEIVERRVGGPVNSLSHRSLKSCLLWLRWANSHLARVIASLKGLLEQYEAMLNKPPGETGEEERSTVLGRIEGAKDEIVKTLRKCVEVVSLYAGAALPEQARTTVRRHIFALPRKFQLALSTPAPTAAASAGASGASGAQGEKLNSANRVLILAKEGLDMMKQVSDVVEETIQKAEGWCEFLGRKGVGGQGQAGQEVKMEEGQAGQGEVRGRVGWREDEPSMEGVTRS
ncbi:Opi1-domain-containing protein [Ascobolus immersus RN42]|uniref:Opi1-domain-containing protein n=1 Tax=Ascobolus immersus RN42 TaxID=1160509 RepID=A0A3N4ICR0_ASCIM|nr:Opi1-domain-containing protein [Ascobolus immersus RN42]